LTSHDPDREEMKNAGRKMNGKFPVARVPEMVCDVIRDDEPVQMYAVNNCLEVAF